MYSYKEILCDNKIIKEYDKIDKINNYYMSHGLKHVKSVVKTCKKLALVLALNEKDVNNLLIAASLHDIGAATGRDNHANKSAKFSKIYLEGKLDIDDINIIYNIIDRHGFNSKKETILEILLCFADKIDFTIDRLEDNYQKKYKFISVLEKLLKVEFNIEKDKIIVKFITDGNLTIEELC